MKTLIEDVGHSLPSMVQLGQHGKFNTKRKVYKYWYGYYDLNTRLWDKVKMLLKYG